MSKVLSNSVIGYVYITTNLLNGKIYIGRHMSTRFDPNYIGTGKILLKAIKKYGINNFDCHIIDYAYSIKDIDNKEIYWIHKYDSTNSEIGYNISSGGHAGRFYGEHNGMYGKHHTDEVKRKLSDLAKNNTNPFGRKNHDYESKRIAGIKRYASNRPESHNINISKSLKGRKLSDELKSKIAENSKKNWVPYKMTNASIKARRERQKQGIPWNSYESRRKISDTLTGSKWMYNDNECLLVHKQDIDSYLSNGYKFGKVKKEVIIK